MKPKFLSGLLVLVLVAFTSGCLIGPDSGSESGTTVDMKPPMDPNDYSCSPLTDEAGDSGLSSEHGVYSDLYYLTPDQPHYNHVDDYFQYGTKVSDLELYLDKVYVPTRPFDRGFVTAGGTTIQTNQGDTLYEYFALKMRGRLIRGNLPKGPYQVALLSDDGAVLKMDLGGGLQTIVDNDGDHPTQLGCAPAAIDLDDGEIPFEINYYQGPRYHISLVWMIRPWPADNDPNDPQCGKNGNDMYFDSTQDPPAPMNAYDQMLARGWTPLQPENFLLPEDKIQNPCLEPAPVISNFRIETITSTSVILSWDTDREATTQILYRKAVETIYSATTERQDGLTHHEVVLGLSSNTDYLFKAVSKSYSGLSSESNELAARTRR